MSARPTRTLLVAGAVPLFFLSFLMSGSSNALPQVFLQRHAPGSKALLLSVALLLATSGATLGVLASRRLRLPPGVLLAGLAGVAVAVQALLLAPTVPVFIALLVLLEFLVNLLVDQVDHGAVARAGGLAGFNDTAGNTARLLGMLLAPGFFTLLAEGPGLQRAALGAAAVAALAGAWFLLRLPCATAAPGAPGSDGPGAPLRGDYVVFGHALAVYAGMYLLAVNAIFLLQDVFGFDGAPARGGGLIVTVFASAIVANGVAGLGASLAPAGRPRTLAGLLAPALALAATAAAPLAGLRPPYAVCLAAAAGVGIGYGFFLREVRRHASQAARDGRGRVLGWFNNMANVSALLAFGLMFAISRAVPPAAYHACVLASVVVLQGVGAALLATLAAGPGRLPRVPA